MTSKNWKVIVAFVTLSLLTGILRLQFPERGLEETGVRAIFNALFAVSLLGFVIIIAAGLGLKLQSILGSIEFDSFLEQLIFAVAAGLGILAYGVLALGFLSLLNSATLFIWLILAAVFSSGEWSSFITRGITRLSRGFISSLTPGFFILTILGSIIFLLSAAQALTPLWDYDGLMYHLQAPRLFLESGRIFLLPDLWQANGPMTTEMLFMFGLAFGSDVFAKLLHLVFALALVLLTFTLGKRYIGGMGSWIAAGILLGIPIFPFWGSLAYTDMAWAVYEILALTATLRWMETEKRSWLAMAGIMMGWGIGTKYFALGMAGILGLLIVYHSRTRGLKNVISNAAIFGLIAGLIGIPWYLKNWLWAGNPIYPFIFGGREWTTLRLDLLMTYLKSFGIGENILDLFLLPFNLYTQREAFGTFMMTIDMPSVLFPLVFVSLFFWKNPQLKWIALLAFFRFILWALGSQQTRFLLPLYPILSLLAASVIYVIANRFKPQSGRPLVAYGVIGGVLATTLAYQLIFIPILNPFRVVFGAESKASFLQSARYDYNAHRYIGEAIPSGSRVYQMWDGQAYYCEGKCLVDAEQGQWVHLITSEESIEEQVAALNDQGVTHLLLDIEGLNFMLNHDPSGRHFQAIEYFMNSFQEQCAREIQSWPEVVLYEYTCR